MNIFQSMNATAFFLAVSALLIGVNNTIPGFKDDLINEKTGLLAFTLKYMDVLVFAVFFILLKIKMTFDDHKFFRDPAQDKSPYRAIGFLIAIGSWLFWPLAGYAVGNLKVATFLLIVALTVSFAWVVVHYVELLRLENRSPQAAADQALRESWLGYYLLYVGGLGFYCYHAVANPTLASLTLGACVVVVAVDAYRSETFFNAQRNSL